MVYFKYFIFIILFASQFAHATVGKGKQGLLYLPEAYGVGEGAYEIFAGTKYWQTTAVYDTTGAEVALESGDSFSKIDSDLNFRYGFSSHIDFKAGVLFRYNSSSATVGEGNATTTKDFTNQGVESFYGSLKYNFDSAPNSKMHYSFEFFYRQTSYTNQTFTAGQTLPDEIILGDDGTEFTVWMHSAYKRNRSDYLTASVGYNTPPNALSPEVVYKLASVWTHTKWALMLGVDGVYSLKGDDFTANPEDKPVMASGSSNLFNSINREYVLPYIGANRVFKSWRIGGRVGMIAAGASTDKGIEAGVHIAWSTQGAQEEDRKVGRFKEYLVEGTVLKLSPRGKFIKIDQGLSNDVTKGLRFDIYKTDFFGGNVLVAAGIAYEVGSDWAIIRLVKRYEKIQIKKGFTARGY
ncbi:MAG: hypothetical protein HOM21_06635 [Halobacteriovoraceae bacterium]|jgi:hypothetical protein|nr:hypothetical protein [Halobacteriovoraceae bacterium]